ncbi:MAG: isoprenylcysteine carboxylmethyltransferase family protein [bacterium]
MNLRLFIRGAAMIVILAALLLVLGGRADYWQAWVFGLVNLALITAVAVLLAGVADTIRARMKPAADAKAWDKVLMAFFFPLAGIVIALGALDGGRFGWTSPLPLWVYPPAYVVYVFSAHLHLWAIRANEHYTSTVAIRPGSGHAVIDSGPYRYVRHPGYTGIILMEASISIVLGSLWALVPAGLVGLLLVIRTRLEDAALRRELPGYEAYAERVRYKLLPGVY